MKHICNCGCGTEFTLSQAQKSKKAWGSDKFYINGHFRPKSISIKPKQQGWGI